MAVCRFFHRFLAGRIHSLPSISHFHLTECFSTLANLNLPHNPPSPILFAHFAATNFNLSQADIARIFKSAPSLQKLETLEKVELFVDMLSRHGLTHNQIALIMKKDARIMKFSAERVLEPKLQYLKDFGIPVEGLASMLVRWPSIFNLSLEKSLQPTMAFLKNVFQTKDFLIKALLRNPIILVHNLETTLKPSVAFWEGFGLRGKELLQLLSYRPSLLLFSSLTPAKVELISKIGIATDSKMFKYVLMTVVESRMVTLETKIHKFQQCVLVLEEIMELFRVAPQVFGLSIEKIGQNMDFVVNNMELPANSVVKNKDFLISNLNKVLRPRFLVWQKLKAMGRDVKMKFYTALRMNEERFMSKIV